MTTSSQRPATAWEHQQLQESRRAHVPCLTYSWTDTSIYGDSLCIWKAKASTLIWSLTGNRTNSLLLLLCKRPLFAHHKPARSTESSCISLVDRPCQLDSGFYFALSGLFWQGEGVGGGIKILFSFYFFAPWQEERLLTRQGEMSRKAIIKKKEEKAILRIPEGHFLSFQPKRKLSPSLSHHEVHSRFNYRGRQNKQYPQKAIPATVLKNRNCSGQ